MSTSIVELETPIATTVKTTDDRLTVEIADGRIVSVPLAWYPRLVHATHEERDD